MNVTVTVEPWDNQTPVEDEGVSWKMTFEITTADGALNYTYVIHDPAELNAEKWAQMCEGRMGYYIFYNGNHGDGMIEIRDDGVIWFHSSISGLGDEVFGKMRVPHALVKPQLEVAVALARERGWIRA
jgi:hypothetical protein